MAADDDDALFPLPPVEETKAVQKEEPGPVEKSFRPYDPNQVLLLPPSPEEWLPERHLARFVSELVEEALDLSAIRAAYTEERGYPPYNPRLMVKAWSPVPKLPAGLRSFESRRRLDGRSSQSQPRRRTTSTPPVGSAWGAPVSSAPSGPLSERPLIWSGWQSQRFACKRRSSMEMHWWRHNRRGRVYVRHTVP
jgi:hypothetical protein